jgi:hypothetical protein
MVCFQLFNNIVFGILLARSVVSDENDLPISESCISSRSTINSTPAPPIQYLDTATTYMATVVYMCKRPGGGEPFIETTFLS